MAFGDWGASTRHTPHFWSLAVEEQFYLVWPAVVLWAGARRLLPLCLWLIAGSLALRLGLEVAHAGSTLVLLATPCRLDALAIGALIATVARRPNGPSTLRLAYPGFALACAGVAGLILWRGNLAQRDPVIGSLGLTVMALLFGTTLAIAIQLKPRTVLHRLFVLPPLRFAGRYGYGIYVIHYPVMIILADLGWNYEQLAVRFGTPATAEGVLVGVNVGVTLALALLSFHLLEQPFLTLKSRFGYGHEAARTASGAAADRRPMTQPTEGA
jgi:peptidoglycan/LPS O-acetylase OafA/YrhL